MCKNILIMSRKDKTIAMLLALFLGTMGIHRFYLDQPGRGILHLILMFTGISAIIGFIDFIGFLTMSQRTFDWKYNPHLFGKMRHRPRYDNAYRAVNNPPNLNAMHTAPRQQTTQRKKRPQPTPGSISEHKQILRKVSQLREAILNKIKRSDQFDNGIVRDIKPLVDKYLNQVKELVERDEKLERIIAKNPIAEIDMQISRLKQKATETNSDMLKYEYQNAVQKHEKHKNSIEEFVEQREMISLRLNSTVMSLEQIKFDLLRIESLAADEQRSEFTRIFEEKSADLSNYLSLLKDSYSAN